ncbi:MAG: hypothetical protein R2711_18830 [Acidimicrobiales bacterium]
MDENPKRWAPAIGVGVLLVIALIVLGVKTFGDDGDETTTTTAATTTTTTAAPTLGGHGHHRGRRRAHHERGPDHRRPHHHAGDHHLHGPQRPAEHHDDRARRAHRRRRRHRPQRVRRPQPFACYDAGARGLEPPSSIGPVAPWRSESDNAVDGACGRGSMPACYEAGRRRPPHRRLSPPGPDGTKVPPHQRPRPDAGTPGGTYPRGWTTPEETTMGHYADVAADLRDPTRALRRAIPDTWAGFGQLHQHAVADGAPPHPSEGRPSR